MLASNEQLLSLSEARKIIKNRTGRRVDLSTVWRWCMHGLRGVRLEHLRAGRELRTSAEALERFYQRLAGAYLDQPADAPADTSAHDQAERELTEAGIV